MRMGLLARWEASILLVSLLRTSVKPAARSNALVSSVAELSMKVACLRIIFTNSVPS